MHRSHLQFRWSRPSARIKESPASRGRCRRVRGLLGVALVLLAPALANGMAPVRGDVDKTGIVNITDAINILGFLFLTNPAPYCEAVADANNDDTLNLTDAVQVLNFLFLAGPPLPELDDNEWQECGGGSNEAPTIPSRPVYLTYPGFPVQVAIGAVDPEGDELSYEAQGLPAGATLAAATGVLRWTPGEALLGPVYVSYAVLDEARPPNRVEGRLVFQVLPLDRCNRPRCDPASGCEQVLVGLATDCCGDPAARVPDPDVGCPEGAVLHVGRNSQSAPSIGRLQNCDRLRLAILDQEGYESRFNIEARCIDPEQALIRIRLETADGVLIDQSTRRNLVPQPGGYYELSGLRYLADGAFSEWVEGLLTASIRDRNGVELERKVRVVLTLQRLPDLP